MSARDHGAVSDTGSIVAAEEGELEEESENEELSEFYDGDSSDSLEQEATATRVVDFPAPPSHQLRASRSTASQQHLSTVDLAAMDRAAAHALAPSAQHIQALLGRVEALRRSDAVRVVESPQRAQRAEPVPPLPSPAHRNDDDGGARERAQLRLAVAKRRAIVRTKRRATEPAARRDAQEARATPRRRTPRSGPATPRRSSPSTSAAAARSAARSASPRSASPLTPSPRSARLRGARRSPHSDEVKQRFQSWLAAQPGYAAAQLAARRAPPAAASHSPQRVADDDDALLTCDSNPSDFVWVNGELVARSPEPPVVDAREATLLASGVEWPAWPAWPAADAEAARRAPARRAPLGHAPRRRVRRSPPLRAPSPPVSPARSQPSTEPPRAYRETFSTTAEEDPRAASEVFDALFALSLQEDGAVGGRGGLRTRSAAAAAAAMVDVAPATGDATEHGDERPGRGGFAVHGDDVELVDAKVALSPALKVAREERREEEAAQRAEEEARDGAFLRTAFPDLNSFPRIHIGEVNVRCTRHPAPRSSVSFLPALRLRLARAHSLTRRTRSLPRPVFDPSDMSYENLSLLDYSRNRKANGLTFDELLQLRCIRFRLPSTGASCSVCLEDFDEGDHAVVLKCAHRFHARCIVRWLTGHHECPNCRLSLRRRDRRTSGAELSARRSRRDAARSTSTSVARSGALASPPAAGSPPRRGQRPINAFSSPGVAASLLHSSGWR
jgi:hypothetical protein